MKCGQKCAKEKCQLWVILTNTVKDSDGKVESKLEGKCAISWIPQLLIELRNKGV